MSDEGWSSPYTDPSLIWALAPSNERHVVDRDLSVAPVVRVFSILHTGSPEEAQMAHGLSETNSPVADVQYSGSTPIPATAGPAFETAFEPVAQ
jgi:hypothetical protein